MWRWSRCSWWVPLLWPHKLELERPMKSFQLWQLFMQDVDMICSQAPQDSIDLHQHQQHRQMFTLGLSNVWSCTQHLILHTLLVLWQIKPVGRWIPKTTQNIKMLIRMRNPFMPSIYEMKHQNQQETFELQPIIWEENLRDPTSCISKFTNYHPSLHQPGHKRIRALLSHLKPLHF
jgi:hypothetical protein